jgi:hypothetical protein
MAKTAVATRKTTAVALPWDEELEPFAQQAKAVVQGTGGKYLSLRNGTISYNSQQIGDTVDFIVLASVRENAFYNGKFDADNPRAPACYAINADVNDLAPMEGCDEPQSDTCKGCRWDAWGSADQGKGKACKNTARIAILPWTGEETEDEIAKKEIIYIRTSVTSTRKWLDYYNNNIVADYRNTIGTLVTRMSIEADKKTQFTLDFETVDGIDRDLAIAVRGRLKQANADIMHGLGSNLGQAAAPVKQRDASKRAYVRKK